MKKKGFTLVELLAVIVVLGVLALIVIPNVTNTLKNSEQELYEVQLELIKEAAKGYIGENILKLDLSQEFTIYLKQLQYGNYIDKNIKNPKTNEPFGLCLVVKVSPIDAGTSTSGYEIKIDENTVNNVIASEFVYGDVRVDGIINVKDAIMTSQYANGSRELTDEQLAAADVNLDCIVDEVDANLILSYVSGVISSLPVTN